MRHSHRTAHPLLSPPFFLHCRAVQWPYAPGVQTYPGVRPRNGTTCYNPATGATAGPCSVMCEALGQGPPLWGLLPPSGGAGTGAPPGGVASAFLGTRTETADPAKCKFDPGTGTEVPRSTVVAYQCDPAMPAGTVRVLSVAEAPQCTYTMSVRTAAACPVKLPPGGPPLPPSSPALPVPPPGAALPPPGAFAPYLCEPVLPDAAGVRWAYNLTRLYRSPAQGDYAFDAPSRGNFSFNVCGFAAATCAPSYPAASNYAVAVQFLTSQPPPAGTPCYLTNSTLVPCTPDCEPLTSGGPIMSLFTPGVGGTGINITYAGVPPVAADPHVCPPDPITGLSLARTWSLSISCDKSMPPGTLRVLDVAASGPCATEAVAASADACGVAV